MHDEEERLAQARRSAPVLHRGVGRDDGGPGRALHDDDTDVGGARALRDGTMTAGMPAGSPATDAFRAARDQLMGWRGDHAPRSSGFRWPDVGRPVQLGGRLVRRRRPRQRPACADDRRGGRQPSASQS